MYSEGNTFYKNYELIKLRIMYKSIIVIMGYPASENSSLAKNYEKQGYYRLNLELCGGSLDGLVQYIEQELIITMLLVLYWMISILRLNLVNQSLNGLKIITSILYVFMLIMT